MSESQALLSHPLALTPAPGDMNQVVNPLPTTLKLIDPETATFLVVIPLSAGIVCDHAADMDPTSLPTDNDTCLVRAAPALTLHTRLVSDTHLELSLAVLQRCALGVILPDCIPDPDRVALIEPVHIELETVKNPEM